MKKNMKLDDVNITRLAAVLNTLQRAITLLREQGSLGRSQGGGTCSNRQTLPSGQTVGCVVGLLVGVENFTDGDVEFVTSLSTETKAKAWENTVGGDFDYLGSEHRHMYVAFLRSLQKVHDGVNFYQASEFRDGHLEAVLLIYILISAQVESMLALCGGIYSADTDFFIRPLSIELHGRDGAEQMTESVYVKSTMIIDRIREFVAKH